MEVKVGGYQKEKGHCAKGQRDVLSIENQNRI